VKRFYGLMTAVIFAIVLNGAAVSLHPETGRVAHGVGGGQIGADNRNLDGGGSGNSAIWYDAAHVAYQHMGGDGLYVALVDVNTGAVTRVPGGAAGANQVSAGGGVAAWWLGSPTGGLFTTTGFRCVECGAPVVGPDGAIAYKPQYQSNGPVNVRERDGTTWRLTDEVAWDIELLGQRRAIWRVNFEPRVLNLPTPKTLTPMGWRPRAANVGGEWWIVYFNATKGLVAHPFNSLRGYVVRGPTVGSFAHDAVGLGRTLRIAYGLNEAEQGGSVEVRDINVDTESRADLGATDPPPPPPASKIQAATVTVDRFTLTPKASLPDGTVFEFHDPSNPQLATRVRGWVEGGSIFFSLDYPGAGPNLLGRTAARRPVR
jgi:hypothetical protein